MGDSQTSEGGEAWAVGTRLRLQTLSSDSVIEGEVYSHDTATGVLVLQVWPGSTTHTSSTHTSTTSPHDLNPITQNKKSYRILNVAHLRNVHSASSTNTPSTPSTLRPVRPIDVQRIGAKEAQALAEAQRDVERIGIGVGSAAQRIFNALSKTLPCKWDKDTIVVFDDLRINPPYRVEDVRGGPKTIDRELNRVKQVVPCISQ
eukprot:TRINITY_DN5594_c0_g1_i4.p1 TRINITY_DN5594_c0_g1~~TRINITY_DN5594_c0_g1_i4.p1  ORF type:complete len:203 (-),score=47.29 TRINITY_DN5594_c0_g1_i4:226-834(-)